jgi:plasmid stabilization system protein ParE
VNAALTQLATYPEIDPLSRTDPRTRRLLLRRFPYQIAYRASATEVIVVAIAHLKRHPSYWKHRS